MKKMLIMGILFMLVLATLFIAGCKKDENVIIAPSSNNKDTGASVEKDNKKDSDSSDKTPSQPAASGDQTKIDLAVTNVYWATIYPEPGDDVKLTVKVTNLGLETAESFSYKLKITKDGEVWKEEVFSVDEPLGRGNSSSLKNTFTLPKGEYTVQVHLDNKNVIRELNEFNNVMETKAPARAMIINQPSPSNDDDDEE